MIGFLDPDPWTHLGSALWRELCTEKELCVILKVMSLEKQVLFGGFCFKAHTLQMFHLQRHPMGEIFLLERGAQLSAPHTLTSGRCRIHIIAAALGAKSKGTTECLLLDLAPEDEWVSTAWRGP